MKLVSLQQKKIFLRFYLVAFVAKVKISSPRGKKDLDKFPMQRV